MVAPNTEFIDTINANDPNTNGNDIKMDGTSPEDVNNIWGQTYQYYVLARDDNDAPGTNTEPAPGEAVVVGAQCDNQPPRLEDIVQGPKNDDYVQAKEHIIRVSMNYVDWADLDGVGSFEVRWKVNGGATQGVGTKMTKVSGGYPGATVLEGILDLTGVANGDTVESVG